MKIIKITILKPNKVINCLVDLVDKTIFDFLPPNSSIFVLNLVRIDYFD